MLFMIYGMLFQIYISDFINKIYRKVHKLPYLLCKMSSIA